MPRNIVDVATVILKAGVTQSALDETLNLVAVARECDVQTTLINLLCDYGADPNGATRTVAMHGEFAGVEAVIRRGAQLDLLLAAALGRVEDVHRLLQSSSNEDRHWALALASQFGKVKIVRMLFDAGEDPNRCNPVGGHSHSTPLHQAAAAGNLKEVQNQVGETRCGKPRLPNGHSMKAKQKSKRISVPRWPHAVTGDLASANKCISVST